MSTRCVWCNRGDGALIEAILGLMALTALLQVLILVFSPSLPGREARR